MLYRIGRLVASVGAAYAARLRSTIPGETGLVKREYHLARRDLIRQMAALLAESPPALGLEAGDGFATR
jgi:hypothetical protein